MQEDYWPMGEHPQQAEMQMPVLSQCPWFSFPFSLLLNLKKRIKKKKKKNKGREEEGAAKEGDRQTDRGREEPLHTGTVIIHVDVNISTKTGSRKIS